MNVGSVNWLYAMMKPVTAADPSGEADQPLTFRGRAIVGYARDGLPIVSETPEERQQEIDRLLAAEAARGGDVSNPKFVIMNRPITDGPTGPIVGYEQRVGLHVQARVRTAGGESFTPSPLPPELLERLQAIREQIEARPPVPTHGPLDAIAGSDETTTEGSERIYAAFYHRGDLYATVDADGAVTIEGTAAYLTEALAGVEGAEARTALLERLIRPDPATRYSDAATAPTFDELWNPKPKAAA
jgi:hypothetical protein